MNQEIRLGWEDRIRAGGVVKIDGLREPEHAVTAAAAGADMIGFIFAPARRQVGVGQARVCIDAARNQIGEERPLFSVGVFVDASAEEIARVVDAAGLDLVQLHGAEPPSLVRQLPVPAIKTLRPTSGESASLVLKRAATFQTGPGEGPLLLIDAYHPHLAGGTGERADWSIAAEVARRIPIVLAGGLEPGNVGEAIATVRPIGVDVSSGVERGGIKDSALIEEFVAAARVGFAATLGGA